MSIETQRVAYEHDGRTMDGFFARPDDDDNRPVILVAHAWAGQGEQEREKTKALAELGYAAFAIDLYGEGRRGSSVEENQALMTPFMEDRGRIVAGMHAALDAARNQPGADTGQVGAIGFCFGGLCVLDFARSGADIAGVVSFHGLFEPPPSPSEGIKARVLALHGWDDPMVPPERVTGLARELTEARADWQIHAYGNTMHAFTNPDANDADFGTVYNAVAAGRAWQAMRDFFAEVFSR